MTPIATGRPASLLTLVAVLALPACAPSINPEDASLYWSAYYAAAVADRAKSDADPAHAIDPLKWVAAAEKAIGIDESPRKRTAWLDWTRVNRRVEYEKRADAAERYVEARLDAVKALSQNVDACLRIAQSDTAPVAQAALDAALKAGASTDHADAITAAHEHIASVTAIDEKKSGDANAGS